MFNRLSAVLAFSLAVAGCGIIGGAPSPIGSQDQTVLIAGDLGAVGCAAFALQGKPSDVALARLASGQLAAVLASPNPTIAAFSVVCTQAPEKYSAICAVVLQRVGVRLGAGVDIIPRDSPAFQALDAFTSACAAALG